VILIAGLVVSFGLRLTIYYIKERTTYLRTGYVAPTDGLKSKRSLIITIFFIFIFLGSNYFFTTRVAQDILWSPGLAGLGFALVFTWIGVLTKLRRLYFLAVLSLCLGIALVILGVDYFQGVGVLAGVVGLILFYQGYRTHKVYIKRNPLLNDSIDE